MNSSCKTRNTLHGFMLISTLITLSVLTVMVLGTLAFYKTQTQIVANAADAQIAFQTAEGALNDATNKLLSGQYNHTSFASNSHGLYLFDANSASILSTINWASQSDRLASYQGNSSAEAAYVIEQLPPGITPGQNMKKPAFVYRITVYAVGPSGQSPVILQSTLQIQQ